MMKTIIMMTITAIIWMMIMIQMTYSVRHDFLISAGNKILSIKADGNQTTIYEDSRSKFISLAVDLHEDRLIFWSDMGMVRKGIYEGRLGERDVTGVEKLPLYPNVDTVYCLAIDPVTNSLYWTDAVHKTIEVYSYKTKYRKIIVFEGLGSPRGITLDLYNGYLFWNDQDYKRIERSRLDGSDRMVVVRNAALPNHMACHKGRLYWTNTQDKILESINYDGSGRRLVKNFSQQVASGHIFGLAITSTSGSYDNDDEEGEDGDHDDDGDSDDEESENQEEENNDDNDNVMMKNKKEKFIVTGLDGQVFIGNIGDDDDDDDPENGGNGNVYDFEIVSLVHKRLFGAVTLRDHEDWKKLENISNPCDSHCDQFCFNVDDVAKCSCSSYGGLAANGSTCVEPKQILLFTMGKGGFVAYLPDPDFTLNNLTSRDIYFVAKGVRPTAVAYNPRKKVVYWSDVDVQRIMQTSFDGQETSIVLDVMREGGIVDGLVFDSASNLLYFTNIGAIGGIYTWQKVEVIDPDDIGRRRTIINKGGMLRALAVDTANNHIYYTDWGETGSITRSNMEGTEVKVIRSGLDNPNGLVLMHHMIYFVDSHYKSENKQASLYRMKMDGSDMERIAGVELETPFGLTADKDQNIAIVSDWQTRAIIVSKITPPSSSSSSSSSPSSSSSWSSLDSHPYLKGPEFIMGVLYTNVYNSSGPSPSKCGDSCEGICVQKTTVCLKSSYNADLKDMSSFILVSDMTGIKALNIDVNNDDTFSHQYSIALAPNLNTLTYHSERKELYFQDPFNDRWIRVLVSSRSSDKLFQPNQLITNMLMVRDNLLWFDQRGHLNSLVVGPNRTPLDHSILIRGRVSPHGLREYLGELYWIEGGSQLSLVKIKMSENSSSPHVVLPECTNGRITWTSVFYLYDAHLYVTEGLKDNAKLFKCSLDGSSIPELLTTLQNPQDLYIFNGHVLYTNRIEGTLMLTHLNQRSNGMTRTIMEGLTRPANIIVHWNQSRQTVCSQKDKSEQCPNGSCIPLMGRLIVCDCPSGLVYDQNTKQCIDPTNSNLRCQHSNITLNHLQTININDCKSCQCMGQGRTIGESEDMKGLVCRTIQCSPCNGQRETKVDGQCCPICGDPCYAPEFSGCPKKPREYRLPKDQNFVIDKFVPQTQDCPNVFRNINLTRIPVSNVIQWDENNVGQVNKVKYVGTAFGSAGELVKVECNYVVVLRDETPPTITCPNNITITTFSSEANNVRWPAPKVFDNSDQYALSYSHEQGMTFNLGKHKVTYVATDTAGSEKECSFNVIIEKSRDTVSCDVKEVCPIRQILNGRLNCSCVIGQLSCHVICDHGYVMSDESSTNFTCGSDGIWTPTAAKDMESTTCVRKVSRTLTHTSIINLKDACRNDPDEEFTRKFIEQQYKGVLHNIARESDPHLYESIQVENCAGENMVVEFQLKRKTEDEEISGVKPIMEKVMDDVMKSLQRDLITFSILPSNSTVIENIYAYEVVGRWFNSSCEPGEIPNKDGCIKCPPGTFSNISSTQSQCSPCPEMTFNLEEGKDRCVPCRGEHIGHVGDVQCLIAAGATSGEPKGKQPYIIASLCIVLVLLFFIAMTFFGIRHCRKTGKYAMRRDQVNGNDKIYDYEEAEVGTLSHRRIKQNDHLLNNGSNNYELFDHDYDVNNKPLMA